MYQSICSYFKTTIDWVVIQEGSDGSEFSCAHYLAIKTLFLLLFFFFFFLVCAQFTYRFAILTAKQQRYIASGLRLIVFLVPVSISILYQNASNVN